MRFDWSEQKVHSLSDQTTKLLAGLDGDVQVLALYPAVEAQPVREILDRYAYASPRFKVEFADPTERPDLLEKYGITEEQLGHGLVRVAIGEESTQLTDVNEENLTNAIVKLTRTDREDRLLPRGPQRARDWRARPGRARTASRAPPRR